MLVCLFSTKASQVGHASKVNFQAHVKSPAVKPEVSDTDREAIRAMRQEAIGPKTQQQDNPRVLIAQIFSLNGLMEGLCYRIMGYKSSKHHVEIPAVDWPLVQHVASVDPELKSKMFSRLEYYMSDAQKQWFKLPSSNLLNANDLAQKFTPAFIADWVKYVSMEQTIRKSFPNLSEKIEALSPDLIQFFLARAYQVVVDQNVIAAALKGPAKLEQQSYRMDTADRNQSVAAIRKWLIKEFKARRLNIGDKIDRATFEKVTVPEDIPATHVTYAKERLTQERIFLMGDKKESPVLLRDPSQKAGKDTPQVIAVMRQNGFLRQPETAVYDPDPPAKTLVKMVQFIETAPREGEVVKDKTNPYGKLQITKQGKMPDMGTMRTLLGSSYTDLNSAYAYLEGHKVIETRREPISPTRQGEKTNHYVKRDIPGALNYAANVLATELKMLKAKPKMEDGKQKTKERPVFPLKDVLTEFLKRYGN